MEHSLYELPKFYPLKNDWNNDSNWWFSKCEFLLTWPITIDKFCSQPTNNNNNLKILFIWDKEYKKEVTAENTMIPHQNLIKGNASALCIR